MGVEGTSCAERTAAGVLGLEILHSFHNAEKNCRPIGWNARSHRHSRGKALVDSSHYPTTDYHAGADSPNAADVRLPPTGTHR